MFPIACVLQRTGYNEAGAIVPHKTEVAIALWRIAVSIANMFDNSTPVPDTIPCRGHLIEDLQAVVF